jgi:hypothetical protein
MDGMLKLGARLEPELLPVPRYPLRNTSGK